MITTKAINSQVKNLVNNFWITFSSQSNHLFSNNISNIQTLIKKDVKKIETASLTKNNSFFITDQYDGLRALEWDDPNSEEMIKAISCAYLSDQYLTSIVRKKKDLKDKKEDIQNKDEKSDTAKVNA